MGIDERVLKAAPFPLGDTAKIVVAANVGSASHGTHIPPVDGGIDDVDVLGAIMPPVERLLGLEGWEHWVQMIDELDVTFFSLPKMVRMWLAGNPNVLGLLWLREEDVIEASSTYWEFRAIRHAFVSQRVVDAFGGYAHSQIRAIHKNRHEGYMGKKRQKLVEQFGYDTKSAAHSIRLLRMTRDFVDSLELVVMRPDAEELKAIKRGEWTLEAVQSEAAELWEQIEKRRADRYIPPSPNTRLVNEVLVEAMRVWVTEGLV